MPGKIFISYRRDDDPNGAARVRDALAAKFGKASIFMDVDNLLAGLRFDDELAKALAACDIFIAVIGTRWLDLLKAKAASGDRDYVCEEIAEALKRKIAVIPVRVGRDGQLAPLPRPGDLTPEILDLVHYQKHDVTHEHFARDASALADAIVAVRQHLRPAGSSSLPRLPLPWLVATVLGALGIAYFGAYSAGIPVPWPGTPTAVTGPSGSDPAAQVQREREARAKAEAAARRDVVAALPPGSGKFARDRLANGQPCPMCPEMVVVPAGEFMMGSTAEEIDAVSKERPDAVQFVKQEGPRRKVSIARPFAVGRSHITRGEFAAFVTASGYKTEDGCYSYANFDGKDWKLDAALSWRWPGFEQTDAHPVVCVNWLDVLAYTEWLSRTTGKSYRPMSEAEAEYVTRATTQATRQPRYFFGNDYRDLCTYANGADRAAAVKFNWDLKTVMPCDDGFVYTAPVARFKANAWGLHDVHGNAWSWTADCFTGTYIGAPSDGSVRTDGDCISRALRGGSWFGIPQLIRAAVRLAASPGSRSRYLGFRLVRTLNP